MSLSMRDVDQETGQDLNPSSSVKKSREEDLLLRNPEHPGFSGGGHGLLQTLKESNVAMAEDDNDGNVTKKKVSCNFIYKKIINHMKNSNVTSNKLLPKCAIIF